MSLLSRLDTEVCDMCKNTFPMYMIEFLGAKFYCTNCAFLRRRQIKQLDIECIKARANLRATFLKFFLEN